MQDAPYTYMLRFNKDILPFICTLLDSFKVHGEVVMDFFNDLLEAQLTDVLLTLSSHKDNCNGGIFILNFHDYIDTLLSVYISDDAQDNMYQNIVAVQRRLSFLQAKASELDEESFVTILTELCADNQSVFDKQLLSCLQQYYAAILSLHLYFRSKLSEMNKQNISTDLSAFVYVAPEFPEYIRSLLMLSETNVDRQFEHTEYDLDEALRSFSLLTSVGIADERFRNILTEKNTDSVWKAYMTTLKETNIRDVGPVILKSEFWNTKEEDLVV